VYKTYITDLAMSMTPTVYEYNNK